MRRLPGPWLGTPATQQRQGIKNGSLVGIAPVGLFFFLLLKRLALILTVFIIFFNWSFCHWRAQWRRPRPRLNVSTNVASRLDVLFYCGFLSRNATQHVAELSHGPVLWRSGVESADMFFFIIVFYFFFAAVAS